MKKKYKYFVCYETFPSVWDPHETFGNGWETVLAYNKKEVKEMFAYPGVRIISIRRLDSEKA